jgi:glycosyltransferase involved in cell wall biosynthesis
MALPVVATSIPGIVDAVQDGVTGTLVPARDVSALAGALCSHLENRAMRAEMGAAGRRRILRDFRQELIWGALGDYYRALAGETGTRHEGARAAHDTL